MSPILIGVVADRLHGQGLSRANALQQSLYLPVFTTVIGGFCFLACARHLQRDRTEALTPTGYEGVAGDDGLSELGEFELTPRLQTATSANAPAAIA